MLPKIHPPTQIRFMNDEEHGIATRVLGSELPSRFRIWITNAHTDDDRAFVIPTSVITTIFGAPLGFPGLAGGYLSSILNVGYLVNVGSKSSDLVSSKDRKRLLVHETVHVWQGHHGFLSANFFAEAMWCHATMGDSAYDFKPGKEWSTYNPEQQANLVQTWFLGGESEEHELWPYIRDNFRPKPQTTCRDYEESMSLQCRR